MDALTGVPDAYETRRPVPPLTGTYRGPTPDDAYASQRAQIRTRVTRCG